MYMVKITAAIGLLACLAGGAQAKNPMIPLVAMSVDDSRDFIGKKDKKNKTAKDISGIGCVPPQGDTYKCLVVNDENKGAQFATIRKDELAAGKFIPLIGDEASPKALGSPPRTCKHSGDFDNMDGEGVAYAEPFFYVVGSHGCSRHGYEFHLSSFILARVRVDAQGRPVDGFGGLLGKKEFFRAVETTYRVSDWLMAAEDVGAFFGNNLEKNGLNIEGVAVYGGRIWFGLRAPVTKASRDGKEFEKQAFVVGGEVTDLFESGDKPSKTKPKVAFFDLDERGIRDLAVLPDGRLLVLAGPINEEKVAFALFVADPDRNTAKLIGTLPEVQGKAKKKKMVLGKAEAVMLLKVAAGSAQAVILFDSLPNGAPHLAKFAIPD
jgi:hypothetical protein